MDELENKIGAILNDPAMMEKITAMAQSLGAAPAPNAPEPAPMPPLDMAAMQKIMGLVRQSGVDQREQALLGALSGYLSSNRVAKLEKAMRAAKLAKFVASALGGNF